MENDCNQALGFWTVGKQYLNLVEWVSFEIYQQGNKHTSVAKGSSTPEGCLEETKWSDHNLIIPLLFSFYHGLEVFLKGFLCANGIQNKTNHKLSELLSDFKGIYQNNNLISLFEKYINQNDQLPAILKDFCTKSSITIDDFYQALKYTEGTQRNQFHHYLLKYRDQDGVDFFQNLSEL